MVFIHRTLLVVVFVIATLAAPSWHLANLRLIHTIPDTTCIPMARASLLSLWIWNVKWLGMILSERSKDSDPVYLVLPSRRDCLFCEIRRNKRCWMNPGLHTCGNDMRAWYMQQLWLMACVSNHAVLSEQAFLHHPLPAHTTATPILTCNLKPLLPCTHRSYIVLLGLSDFFIHVD